MLVNLYMGLTFHSDTDIGAYAFVDGSETELLCGIATTSCVGTLELIALLRALYYIRSNELPNVVIHTNTKYSEVAMDGRVSKRVARRGITLIEEMEDNGQRIEVTMDGNWDFKSVAKECACAEYYERIED